MSGQGSTGRGFTETITKTTTTTTSTLGSAGLRQSDLTQNQKSSLISDHIMGPPGAYVPRPQQTPSHFSSQYDIRPPLTPSNQSTPQPLNPSIPQPHYPQTPQPHHPQALQTSNPSLSHIPFPPMGQYPMFPPTHDTHSSIPPPPHWPTNPPSEVIPNVSQAFDNFSYPNGSNQSNGSEYSGYGYPPNQHSLNLSTPPTYQPLNPSTPYPQNLPPPGFQQPSNIPNPYSQGPLNPSTAHSQGPFNPSTPHRQPPRRPVTTGEINAYAIRLFTKYDTNRTGSLGLDDTKKVLDDFCKEVKLQKVTYEDLGRLFQLFDYDGNGKIGLSEFKVMLEILGGIKEKMAMKKSTQARSG